MWVMRSRLPGPPLAAGSPCVPGAMDGVYRAVSRRVPTTVQGAELAQRYGGSGAPPLVMTESIMRERDVVSEPAHRDWAGEIHLLTVGRIEPEKNPLLLVDALARLEREHPGRYRVTWIGRGPCRRQSAAALTGWSSATASSCRAIYRSTPACSRLYRTAHVFVHVSPRKECPRC